MDILKADITSVETETYIEDSVTDRVSHMSVSAALSISLYAGLIKVTIISVIQGLKDSRVGSLKA